METVSFVNQGFLCLGTYAFESSQEPTRLCAWDSKAEAWLGTIGTKCTFEEKDVGLSRKVVLGAIASTLAGVRQPHSKEYGLAAHTDAEPASVLPPRLFLNFQRL
jgi:hypothetical protein